MMRARDVEPSPPVTEGGRMGDAVMANLVYERTRSALAGLLPRRAAANVLDRAMRRHRRSPEDVDGEQMARVLLSGVYRELRGILPDPGLRRTLLRLARETRAAAVRGRGATPSQVRAGPAKARPPIAAAPVAPAPDPDGTAAAPSPAPHPEAAAPLPAPDPEAATPSPAVDGGVRSLASLEAVATVLATLDGVHGVGLYDAAGRPLGVRGALQDAAALGRMVAAGAALLETTDQLRTVAIDTPHGRLVALPVRPRWLALTGTTDLNLGAVYAALATLEEER
jgi:hypothetical protein